jgi:hypothetical protein
LFKPKIHLKKLTQFLINHHLIWFDLSPKTGSQSPSQTDSDKYWFQSWSNQTFLLYFQQKQITFESLAVWGLNINLVQNREGSSILNKIDFKIQEFLFIRFVSWNQSFNFQQKPIA